MLAQSLTATLKMRQLFIGNSKPVSYEFRVFGEIFKLADEIQFLIQNISVNRALAMLRLNDFIAAVEPMVELQDDLVPKKLAVTVKADAITF